MRKLAILAVTVLGMWAAQTHALTISVTESGGTINGITGDVNVLGVVVPGIGGEDTEVGFITTLIGMSLPGPATVDGKLYVRSGNFTQAQLPSDDLAFAGKWQATDPGFRWTDLRLNGASYVLAKYAADQGGAVIWYLGDLENPYSVDLPGQFRGHAISHFSVFTTGGYSFDHSALPDGGSTALLLGSALLGLAVVRRK